MRFKVSTFICAISISLNVKELMKTQYLPLLFFVLVALISCTSPLPDMPVPEGEVRGELLVTTIDYQNRTEHNYVLNAEGYHYELEGEELSPALTGKKITVRANLTRGLTNGSALEVFAVVNVTDINASEDPSREREVLVIPAMFEDMEKPHISKSTLEQMYSGDARSSLESYYEKVSGGRYKVETTVLDPVVINKSRPSREEDGYTCSDMEEDAHLLAKKRVDIKSYDVLSTQFPRITGCPWGWGGTATIINGTVNENISGTAHWPLENWASNKDHVKGVILHEHGHTLGLGHMQSKQCEGQDWDNKSACKVREYGGYDVMGDVREGGILNHGFRIKAGLAADQRVVRQSGVYTVNSFFSNGTNTITVNTSDAEPYYVSHIGSTDFILEKEPANYSLGTYIYYFDENQYDVVMLPQAPYGGAWREGDVFHGSSQPFELRPVDVVENRSTVNITIR